MFPHNHKGPQATDVRACIIDQGDRLTLSASLDALRRQPELIDRVVASLFEAPERHTVELIIDRPVASD